MAFGRDGDFLRKDFSESWGKDDAPELSMSDLNQCGLQLRSVSPAGALPLFDTT